MSALRARKIAEKNNLNNLIPDLDQEIGRLDWEIEYYKSEAKAASEINNRFSWQFTGNETLDQLYWKKRTILSDFSQYVDDEYWDIIRDLNENNEQTKQAIGSVRASDNAIINANLSRAWMSAQAWAEWRMKNFLATQEAIAQSDATAANQRAWLVDAQVSKQLWLNQMNSTDIDNYLRAQAISNQEAAMRWWFGRAWGWVSNTARFVPPTQDLSGNSSNKPWNSTTTLEEKALGSTGEKVRDFIVWDGTVNQDLYKVWAVKGMNDAYSQIVESNRNAWLIALPRNVPFGTKKMTSYSPLFVVNNNTNKLVPIKDRDRRTR